MSVSLKNIDSVIVYINLVFFFSIYANYTCTSFVVEIKLLAKSKSLNIFVLPGPIYYSRKHQFFYLVI